MASKRKPVRKEKARDDQRVEATHVAESTVEAARISLFVPDSPIAKIVLIASAIFVIAHALLMIGLATPDKITFDEVHYVPAAKQPWCRTR